MSVNLLAAEVDTALYPTLDLFLGSFVHFLLANLPDGTHNASGAHP